VSLLVPSGGAIGATGAEETSPARAGAVRPVLTTGAATDGRRGRAAGAFSGGGNCGGWSGLRTGGGDVGGVEKSCGIVRTAGGGVVVCVGADVDDVEKPGGIGRTTGGVTCGGGDGSSTFFVA
jgi:hypothetical protein